MRAAPRLLGVAVVVVLASAMDLAALPPVFCLESWCRYSPYSWPHDGVPYESERIIVYSDSASNASKRMVAEATEQVLAEIEEALGIESMLYDFPPGRDKIDVYVDLSRPVVWGGWAYYGGFLVSGRVCSETACHKQTLKHEMMHVVAYLLEGYRTTDFMYTDVWFDEGLAEHVSGARRITSPHALRIYRNRIQPYLEDGNPIRVRTWSDFDPPSAGLYGEGLYPLFELAVRYLVDENGLGGSPEDAVSVFLDIRAGLTFAEAFENRFGFSLADYEASFFERMADYVE